MRQPNIHFLIRLLLSSSYSVITALIVFRPLVVLTVMKYMPGRKLPRCKS
jgi:hypothetical protein